MLEIGFVTVFCPVIVTQTGETKFVVDSKLKPVTFVGHVKITSLPRGVIVSCGAAGNGNERLKIVPLPELPPSDAVPYRILFDIITAFVGLAPSPLVFPTSELKLYKLVKPLPSVLMANTVPLLEEP